MRLPTTSSSNPTVGLLLWFLGVFATAAVGGLASANAPEFYRDLVRPPWAPPGWLFGPAWAVLYTMMAVAAWLVWRSRGFAGARAALIVFIVQLVANALWTWLFFVWHQGGLAFAEVLVLWALILTTIVMFNRVNRTAALLLVPYLMWVSFATALTWATWRLNPGILG